MNKIDVLKGILNAKELLSNSEMNFIKGGANEDDQGEDEQGVKVQSDDKRRQRPGGGVSTL